MSYAELYTLVADLASAFLARGLQPGDRIASYSSNCIVRTYYHRPYFTSASLRRDSSRSRRGRNATRHGPLRGSELQPYQGGECGAPSRSPDKLV